MTVSSALVLPIANKMRIQSEVEQLNRQIIQEGVGFIQTGGNPRVLQDLLASYIPPDQVSNLALSVS